MKVLQTLRQSRLIAGIVGAVLCAHAGLCGHDPTPEPYLVSDALPGPDGSYPHFLTHVGDRLFFVTWNRRDNQNELWVSDGTVAGTRLLRGFGSPWGSPPENRKFYVSGLTALGERVLFSAFDLDHGWELWASDGTAEGTRILKDILPGPESSEPARLTGAGGRVFFRAWDNEGPTGLWLSDGTQEGTRLLKRIGRNQVPEYLQSAITVVGDLVFFLGPQDAEHGHSLWVSDGTSDGTRVLKEGTEWGGAHEFVAFDGRLFFGASGGLWASDATPEGTVLFKEGV